MKNFLAVLTVLLFASAAIWFDTTRRDAAPATADAAPAEQYAFEAQDVVLRQMDAEGQLQFEIEAERIVQLSEAGGWLTSGVTLYHDPPGTAPGSAQRWTLKARESRLPNEGRIIGLTGDVRAEGLPAGSRNLIRLTTDALDFDMDSQKVFVDGAADFTSGSYSFRGNGLAVDVEAGVVQLESAHGQIALAGATGHPGHLVVEDSRNLHYARDGVLTADDVLITHGADTRITANHARHTQRSGSTSELDLTSQVHIEFRGALLDADSALLNFRRQNLLSVGVKGSQARFSHQPEGYARRVNGSADAIDYDAASSEVTFSGNTSFTNNRGDSFASDIVVYSITSGVVRLESAHGKIAL